MRITVTTYDDYILLFSNKLSEFMVWLNDRVAEIPAEHMDAACIEMSYDGCSENIHIYYERDETDEEIEARERAQRERDERYAASRRLEIENALATLRRHNYEIGR